MGEDGGFLSPTPSGIPIEHLDYHYVEKCTNAREIEKILKVLRFVHCTVCVNCAEQE